MCPLSPATAAPKLSLEEGRRQRERAPVEAPKLGVGRRRCVSPQPQTYGCWGKEGDGGRRVSLPYSCHSGVGESRYPPLPSCLSPACSKFLSHPTVPHLTPFPLPHSLYSTPRLPSHLTCASSPGSKCLISGAATAAAQAHNFRINCRSPEWSSWTTVQELLL